MMRGQQGLTGTKLEAARWKDVSLCERFPMCPSEALHLMRLAHTVQI